MSFIFTLIYALYFRVSVGGNLNIILIEIYTNFLFLIFIYAIISHRVYI